MPNTRGLSVRQFERHGLDFRAELVISEEHSEQVTYGPRANSVGPHTISGNGVDLSIGGAGLECRQYVPRLCNAMLRIFDSEPVGIGPDGIPIHAAIFEHSVKVRRVQMLSNAPIYEIGLAFVDPDIDVEAQVEALKARITEGAKKGTQGGMTRA